jgi:hypothetical protein
MSDAQKISLQKHGQALLVLVDARRRELEKELATGKPTPDRSANLKSAIEALKALLPGDLDQISPTVAQGLTNWIETSKYLTQ